MTTGEIFGSLFGTLLGAFLFYEGFYRLYVLYRIKRKGQHAVGTVVRRAKGDAYNTTVPLISFMDHEGNQVTGIAKNSVPTNGVYIRFAGDTVRIYYDPFNPKNFVIDAIPDQFFCFLFAIAGCLFLYAVVITVYKNL